MVKVMANVIKCCSVLQLIIVSTSYHTFGLGEKEGAWYLKTTMRWTLNLFSATKEIDSIFLSG